MVTANKVVSARKTGRMGTTLQVIVNESRAAKHKAFSQPQGASVLHISLQVGVFKITCQLADFVRAVGIRSENHHSYQLGW